RNRERCLDRMDQRASNDLIAFSVEGQFLHESEQLRSWGDRQSVGDAGETAQCLICGRMSAPVRVHSNLNGLGGASTSGVPIVSFNQASFESYGLEGGENATICADCDQAYATAVNRCLTDRYPDPRMEGATLARQSKYLGNDVTAVFWSDVEGME